MKTLASLAGSTLLFLGSCASTAKVGDSWRNPDAREFAPAKTVVVVISGEMNHRRAAEEEIVQQLGAERSDVSYEFLDASVLADPKHAAELARRHGFDSALVVRVLAGDEAKARVPGKYTPEYLSFGGKSYSLAYLWPGNEVQGEPSLRHTFHLETCLFALADDKLIWSGVVEIRDPASGRELAQLNAEAVLAELRAQKLLR
jgi:hypothetical protein